MGSGRPIRPTYFPDFQDKIEFLKTIITVAIAYTHNAVYGSGPVVRNFLHIISYTTTIKEIRIVITPILKMKKLKHRNIKCLPQDYTHFKCST